MTRGTGATLRLGVVGAGEMGARHVRTIVAHPRTTLCAVVDHSLPRAERLAAQSLHASAGVALELLERCDAVVVASSTAAHVEAAVHLLSRGIPVLVEKPLAPSIAGCDDIIERSIATGVAVMCGFVERFNAAWLLVHDLLGGEPIRVHATRHSPEVARAGSGVVTDLMIHDLDLTATLLSGGLPRRPPLVVQARAVGPSSVEAELDWDRGCRVTFSASREASDRRRVVHIAWDSGRMEIDLLEGVVHVAPSDARRPEKRIVCPSEGTPLGRQLSHFVRLVEGGVDMTAERASIVLPHTLACEIELTANRPVAALDW